MIQQSSCYLYENKYISRCLACCDKDRPLRTILISFSAVAAQLRAYSVDTRAIVGKSLPQKTRLVLHAQYRRKCSQLSYSARHTQMWRMVAVSEPRWSAETHPEEVSILAQFTRFVSVIVLGWYAVVSFCVVAREKLSLGRRQNAATPLSKKLTRVTVMWKTSCVKNLVKLES